jgi:hypothetical protein
MITTNEQTNSIYGILSGEFLSHSRTGKNVDGVKFRQMENGKIFMSIFYAWYTGQTIRCFMIGKRGGIKEIK